MRSTTMVTACDGDRVRLITRRGYDWTKRFPWIAEAALRNRQKRFVIDSEAISIALPNKRNEPSGDFLLIL